MTHRQAMSKRRIAIAGAGRMARARGRALLATGQAEICAVAARHAETARACAAELGCRRCYADYCRLAEADPDVLLIEVPHRVQDQIALWGLEAGLDLLIGGSLASCSASGARIAALAASSGRIVEAGYQRRYDPAWEEMRRLIRSGELGEPIMAVSAALWNPEPHSWYYDQEASGGMPLTHLSYCYLNATRWILGEPVAVSAMANRKVHKAPGQVAEESCAVCIEFAGGAFASATASYAGPAGMGSPEPFFLCAAAGIQVEPETAGRASFTLFPRQGGSEVRSFQSDPPALVRQARAFLQALESRRAGRNPPDDALVDVQIAEAISLAARQRQVVLLPAPTTEPGA